MPQSEHFASGVTPGATSDFLVDAPRADAPGFDAMRAMLLGSGTGAGAGSPSNSGAQASAAPESPVSPSLLQDREQDAEFFRENFLSHPHETLLARACEHPASGACALSIVADGTSYRGLLRMSEGSKRLVADANAVYSEMPFWRRLFGWEPTWKHIAAAMSHSLPTPLPLNALRLCADNAVHIDLIELEEKQIVKTYKFGLTYLRRGQSTEEEMFANCESDAGESYSQFLSFIGEKVALAGWSRFRAGLDVNTGLTGTHSVYTKWKSYEIMFHVATYLPFNSQDKQQLERKRHIGNDLVLLIFQDDASPPFDLSTIKSKQTQVVIVVRLVPEKDKYHVTICRKPGVPDFAPELPTPPLISRDNAGREYLLRKLIMAERASYRSPSFLPKLSRTRGELLSQIAQKYISDS